MDGELLRANVVEMKNTGAAKKAKSLLQPLGVARAKLRGLAESLVTSSHETGRFILRVGREAFSFAWEDLKAVAAARSAEGGKRRSKGAKGGQPATADDP